MDAKIVLIGRNEKNSNKSLGDLHFLGLVSKRLFELMVDQYCFRYLI